MLIIGFVILLVLVGWAFDYIIGFGVVGVVIALLITAALTIGSYWKSDAVALAVSRARPADPQEYKRLYNLVEGLTIAAGLPMPRIYVVEDQAPNAFATGRNPKHAAIAVTTGLLEKMNRVELEGVLAHELSHIKNYDILVSTLAVTMVGAIAVISDIAIRMMWFGGGRRSDDRDGNAAGAIFLVIGLVLLAFAPIIARLMAAAIDAGAEDIVNDGDSWRVTCEPQDVETVRTALEGAGIGVESAEATMISSTEVPLTTPEDAKKVLRVIDALEDHDDVQNVYSNFDIPDSILETVEA